MHLAAHGTGVSFEQVTTGLVRFERSVFAAQAATSKQAQMLARMRFSTDQVKGAMQNLDPFLDLFVGKFAHLHEGPEKVGVAMEFMGRAGANNIKLMQQWARAGGRVPARDARAGDGTGRPSRGRGAGVSDRH